ncbi:MAG TPA: choice-of-anchor tandem repeat GloVer-containing protein, partial [Candidatus Dormibacteraeota bacterium]|nr:choice-of-anchor tandem repeat GloVer-containing protein [Candidatus Dormibacteraeota bacterium]
MERFLRGVPKGSHFWCAAIVLFLVTSWTQAESISLSVLAYFNGTNGATPWAGLIEGRDGQLYGTTYSGGASTNVDQDAVGFGTVFKVSPSGGLTCLASFYGTNGSHPRTGLVQARDGNFYGTTICGGSLTQSVYFGSAGYGTVFKVTAQGTLSSLVSFGITNGACPFAGLVEGPDGALYGTTRWGGANPENSGTVPGYGTIFRVTTNGDLTTLYSFNFGTDGYMPMNGLILARDGNFYGKGDGGVYGWDAVIKMTLQGT